MTKRHKKDVELVGTVLKGLKGAEALKPWAEFMGADEHWKVAGYTAERFMTEWTAPGKVWRFFSAADPKTAKVPGFEHEHGFVAFQAEGGTGFVHAIAAKVRHKGIGKHLLSAAERVISEKCQEVRGEAPEADASTLRFYKNQGYEETSRSGGMVQFLKKF